MAGYKYKLCMGCMEPKDEDGVCPICGYSPNSPSLPAYLPPETFLNDRYIVGRLLRFNGEGADYIGYDTVTSSKVLIREYMPDMLCSRNKDNNALTVNQTCVAQYKAFMSEFVELNKMLAKMRTLNHINPALDMFGDNNTGYVVFRYVEGINLAKYLKEHAGELTWEEVKKLFPPIFTTLSLVHNAGLVHRGISPENIIINDKNELKLIGFCIADVRTANTELASEIYRGYAAPEQYSSSNWQGTWTDVYGICALLYRILTGTQPMDAMERVANDTLPEPKSLNGNIPSHVSKVIMSGMNLSGEMRIQTVTELVTQLFEEPDFTKTRTLAATQTISIPKQHSTKGPVDEPSAHSHSAKASPKRRVKRHHIFMIAGAAAVVVMFVFMGVLMSMLDDNSNPVANGIETTMSVTDGEGVSVSSGIPQIHGTEPYTATEKTEVSPVPTLAVTETSAGQEEAVTTIKPGSTVYIMNDLVGKQYDTVKNTTVTQNMTVVPEYIYTDEYEKGVIFEQSIEKGSNYEKGAEVVLKISMGPAKVLVPEYYGLSKKDYFDLLNSAGIKYEEKEYETEQTLNDYVAWVSIDPGEYVDLEAGQVLTVFVALNPESTTPSETTADESEITTTTQDTGSGFIVPWVTSSTTAQTDEPDIIIGWDY